MFSDIDECVTVGAQTLCGSNAVCSNEAGSYHCICEHGYTGDGVNCTGMYGYISCPNSELSYSDITYISYVLK